MIIDLTPEESKLDKWNKIRAAAEEREKKIKEAEAQLSKSFFEWLANAKSGEEFCYYEGPHLGKVRVAAHARASFDRNEVLLYQKRSETRGHFKYFARRRTYE